MKIDKREIGVHLAHCNIGENKGGCKYGESTKDCPAFKGLYRCKDCGDWRRKKAVAPILVELKICPQCYTKAFTLVKKVEDFAEGKINLKQLRD